jgi:hypothetical protein
MSSQVGTFFRKSDIVSCFNFDVFLAFVAQILDLCLVLNEVTDVSEEYVASIFRVEYRPITLTSHRSKQYFKFITFYDCRNC